MKKPVIRYLSIQEFEEIKKLLFTMGEFNPEEKYALTVTVNDTPVILICNDPSLTKNEKDIILWHEKSHALGIHGEEEADKEALKHLNPKAKELLIANWKNRHGHEYK